MSGGYVPDLARIIRTCDFDPCSNSPPSSSLQAHQETFFHHLVALGAQVESLCSLHVRSPGLVLALPSLRALTRLELSWPGESLPVRERGVGGRDQILV